MELAEQSQATTWRATWLAQAHAHPYTSMGLALALAVVAWLLLTSLWQVAAGEADAALRLGLLGGLAGFAATALGALPALFLRGLSNRTEDTMLGLAAGMMLAASSFSLILPGLAAGEQLTGSSALGALTVVAGLGLGVLLMLGLDEFTPHEHEHLGPCGAGCGRVGRVWLFVFAIALHNLPEGMAIGVSFAQGDLRVGLALTSAIAIQDIPEGLAVAMALKAAGLNPLRAVWVAILSGVMEPGRRAARHRPGKRAGTGLSHRSRAGCRRDNLRGEP
jgi:zinc transporter, ZIP family